MRAKQLTILALLAAALAGWAYFSARERAQKDSGMVGARVLPDLPINEVSRFVLTSPGSTVDVARIDGVWSVPSRYNHPANFEKVADTMRQVNSLTIGQVVNVPPDQLAALDLLAPEEAENGGAGTLLELMDDQERLLGSMVIGKSFMRRPQQGPMMDFGGYPDGQYVRRDDGKVFLVSETLRRLTEEAETWLYDELIDVRAEDVIEIATYGPDRADVHLKRDEDNKLVLAGLDEVTEALDVSEVNRMARALRFFSFDDVASPDLAPGQTGLDEPVVFEARTRRGQFYSLEIGREVPEAPGRRYIRAGVAYDAARPETDPAGEEEPRKPGSPEWDGELARETETQNARLNGWTYIIRSFRADPLLLRRGDLVTAKDPEAEPGHDRK